MYFTDINETTHTSDQLNAVDFACRIGAMNCFLDGSFRPNEPINAFTVDTALSAIFLSNKQRDHRKYPVMNMIPYFKKYKSSETLTVHDLQQIFDELFRPLMVKPCAKAELLQEKSNDAAATRLDLASLLQLYCTNFFNALISQELSNDLKNCLIRKWENTPASPYQLIYNLYQYVLRYAPLLPVFKNQDFVKVLVYFRETDQKTAITSYQRIKEIIDSFKTIKKSTPSHGYQYTSLTALYAMLTISNMAKKNDPPQILLHLNNAIYLNDPREGQLFDEIFKDKTGSELSTKPINHTYILSLSSESNELLPMWVQYADDGKGCRIEFDTTNLNFHPVAYSSRFDTNTNANEYKDIFQQYLLENWDKKSPEYLYLKDMYSNYRFYFKDEAYKTEAEIRFTQSVLPQLAKEHPVRKNELFPRLYCETPYPLTIKSVMLGPKCPNREHIKLNLERLNVPKVTFSNIQYR